MNDVTAVMNDYRECVRHLWNTHFLKNYEKGDSDFIDLYNGIVMDLFRVLVLRKFDREEWTLQPGHWYPQEMLPFLRIDAPSRSSIMINRAQESSYWDDPVNFFWKGELDLRFIRYFDWNVYDFRDFAYYKVAVVGSEKYPHLIGRNALVPVEGVCVLHDEDVPTG